MTEAMKLNHSLYNLAYVLFWLMLVLECYKSFKKAGTGQNTVQGSLFLALLVLPIVACSPSSFLTYYPHWLLLLLQGGYPIMPGRD